MEGKHRQKNNSWSDLQQEILRSIAELLDDDPFDLRHFRMVCKQWRRSTSLPALFPRHLTPHLSLFSSSVYLLRPPSGLSSSSPSPWLLCSVEPTKGNFQFRQIVSNSPLQNLPTNFNPDPFQPCRLAVAYHLTCVPGEDDHCFDKVLVISTNSVPSIADCAVLDLYNGGILRGYAPLAHHKDNNEELVELPSVNISYRCIARFDDVIKLKYKILAVDREGKLYEIDAYTLEIVGVYGGHTVCYSSNNRWRKRLVRTPTGSLYLVVRQSANVKGTTRAKTPAFKVYRLSHSDNLRIWTEAKSFKNRVLFVTRDFCFFVGADELPGFKLKNCMVFSCDGFPRYAKGCWEFPDGGEDNIGVFRLDGPDVFQLLSWCPGLSMVLGSPPSWALQPHTSPPLQSQR